MVVNLIQLSITSSCLLLYILMLLVWLDGAGDEVYKHIHHEDNAGSIEILIIGLEGKIGWIEYHRYG